MLAVFPNAITHLSACVECKLRFFRGAAGAAGAAAAVVAAVVAVVAATAVVAAVVAAAVAAAAAAVAAVAACWCEQQHATDAQRAFPATGGNGWRVDCPSKVRGVIRNRQGGRAARIGRQHFWQ